jgi:hypothetical protein
VLGDQAKATARQQGERFGAVGGVWRGWRIRNAGVEGDGICDPEEWDSNSSDNWPAPQIAYTAPYWPLYRLPSSPPY